MDLLRALASMMIVIYHAHSIALGKAAEASLPFFSLPVWWNACIELFFVMSGFLMVHMSYTLYGRSGGCSEFALRRLIRTPPLYYIYTLIVFAIFISIPGLADYETDIGRLIHSLLFISGDTPPVIAIGWTLNYEAFFYVVVGFSILLAYPMGPLAACAFLCTVVGIGLVTGRLPQPLYTWTHPFMLNFCIGMIVAMFYYGRVSLGTVGRLLALALAVLLALRFSDLEGPFADLRRVPTFGIAMGLVVAVVTLRDHPYTNGRFSGVVKGFADRAYTLYLCHILTLKVFEKVFYRFVDGYFAAFAFFVLGTVAAVAASWVLYPLIEKPLTEYLRGWAKSVRARRQVSQQV